MARAAAAYEDGHSCWLRAVGNIVGSAWASGRPRRQAGLAGGPADRQSQCSMKRWQPPSPARLRPGGVSMTLGQRGHAALAQGEIPLAARFFAESIARGTGRPTRTRRSSAQSPDWQALRWRRTRPTRAARLLGATEAGRESRGVERVTHALHAERMTASTRASLPGADAFEQAWSAGRLLTVEEAVSEALALADEVAAGANG